MHRVLLGTSKKYGRNIKTQCIGPTQNLLNRKECKFYQTRSNAIILHDKLPACCIPKAIMMDTGEIIYEKVYASLLQRFPLEIIGWKNWIQKLLQVVKTPNKSNPNPKPNYQARRDLWVSNHLVCLPRKSEKMSCLAAKAQTQERRDLYLWVDNQQVCSHSSRK